MNRLTKIKILFLFFFCVSFLSYSQTGWKDIRTSKKAYKYFETKNYQKALPLLLRLHDKYPAHSFFNYLTGLCYLNSPAEKIKSVPYLERAIKDSTTMVEAIEAIFYLGQAYHYANRFDDAINMYEHYKNYVPQNKNGIATLKEINRRIEMCNTGKILVAKPTEVIISNLGNKVNSIFPDYAPVISADESMMVFTTRRKENIGNKIDFNGLYYEDIYLSQNTNWQWSEAVSIDSTSIIPNNDTKPVFSLAKRLDPPINTKFHDAAIGLSPSGQKLFIYKRGEIYVSTIKGDKWGRLTKLNTNINYKKNWQPSISISADETTIYFTSDRKGGFGGLDIYKSEKQANGDWGAAINLGDIINTPYDEDSPFIHPDGKTLYFSSKGHNTMGGYDIFESELKNNNWSKPTNIGYPINTSDDDIFYVEAAKGDHAYFASIRNNGYGDMDIYLLLFPGVSIPVTEIKGIVLGGDSLKPISAQIKIIEKIEGKEYNFTNNPENGKYLLILPPNKKYDFIVTAEGYDPYKDEIFIPDQKRFYQLYQEIKFIPVKYKGTPIAEEVVVQNAFFDIEKAILSDSILSKEYNLSNDSLQTEINNKNLNEPIKFESKNDNENDELFSKYINNIPKIIKEESNRTQVYSLATNIEDTISFKQKNQYTYFLPTDSLANILSISNDAVSKLLNRNISETFSLLEMQGTTISKLSFLNETEIENLLNYPEDIRNRIIKLPNESIQKFSTLTPNIANAILTLSDIDLEKLLSLPIPFIELFAMLSDETAKNLIKLPESTITQKLDQFLALDFQSNKKIKDSLLLNNTSIFTVFKDIDKNSTKSTLLPDLYFKVQIAALKNNTDLNEFKGLSEIESQKLTTGLIHYSSGIFTKHNDAVLLKNKIRDMGYSDAFVVAYYKGERIPVKQALSMIDEKTTTTLNDQPEEIELSVTEPNPILQSIVGGLVNPISKIKGLFYTVQVGVYKSPRTAAQLYNISPLYDELIEMGYYRYISGIYANINDALKAKENAIAKGISDAFVVAYYMGKQISLEEAKKRQSNTN
ncbi:MAG TPA: hypothetical protein PLC59_03935 [Bacteroidales bacterium]|nr:hypothetical protein [Bacteroidales bacterium]